MEKKLLRILFVANKINFHLYYLTPSSGISRTGVLIGADIGMRELEEMGQVDVLRIVSSMRQDRGGMVQTKDQYVFLHRVRNQQLIPSDHTHIELIDFSLTTSTHLQLLYDYAQWITRTPHIRVVPPRSSIEEETRFQDEDFG